MNDREFHRGPLPPPPTMRAFTVRIPEPLYNAVKEEALKHKRSITAQIEFELEEVYW